MEFPKNDNTFEIKFKLYKNGLLSNYLGIPKEALPVFATLCSNDYLYISKYRNFSKQLSEYECHHESAEKINIDIYKRIVNLILDLCENINHGVNPKDSSNKSRPKNNKLQNQIIEELFKMKDEETTKYFEKECRNKIIDSIKEYNLTALHENKTKFINKEIMKSYYSGKIHGTILNVLYINHYKCTQYFENLERENCYNISSELRKISYKLILRRNIKSQNNEDENKSESNKLKEINDDVDTTKNKEDNQKEGDFIITEYIRKDNKIVAEEVNIHIDITKSIPYSINSRFEIYLNSFESNNKVIKKLPYYLIPIVISLRYYLIKKIKSNLFICNKKGKKEN